MFSSQMVKHNNTFTSLHAKPRDSWWILEGTWWKTLCAICWLCQLFLLVSSSIQTNYQKWSNCENVSQHNMFGWLNTFGAASHPELILDRGGDTKKKKRSNTITFYPLFLRYLQATAEWPQFSRRSSSCWKWGPLNASILGLLFVASFCVRWAGWWGENQETTERFLCAHK